MRCKFSFDLFVTHGASCDVLYSNGKSAKVPELHCDHIEADTRLFLHSKHAAENHSNIILSSADSDIFVIGLSLVQKLPATIYFEYGKYKIKLLGLHKIFC